MIRAELVGPAFYRCTQTNCESEREAPKLDLRADGNES